MNARLSIPSLLLALALAPRGARAQYTGGRVGGSNWGAAPPAAAPSTGDPMGTAPGFAPPPPPPALPVIPTPEPPPAVAPTAPPEPPAPPPPRVFVRLRPRGPASPGQPTLRAEDRTADEAERRAASPTWTSGEERGPLRWGAGALAGALVFGVGLAFTFAATQPRARTSRRPPPQPGVAPPRPLSLHPSDHPGVEVRSVSVAFYASARAELQARFAQLAASADPSTPPGLYALACAARDLLTGAHGAACYGAFQSFAADPSQAQARFGQLAERARSRYTVETVNNARRVQGPAIRPRAEEGDGLVVVTLLVAARGALPDLPTAVDLPSLMHALQNAVPARPDRLLALELVWSPASPSDRMSSAELATLYPELLQLDPRAAFGRRVCGHCRAVYAAEIGRCPGCGAG
ncbi:MAG: DUF1517 domain-containing protein [Polyangiales bacterium]